MTREMDTARCRTRRRTHQLRPYRHSSSRGPDCGGPGTDPRPGISSPGYRPAPEAYLRKPLGIGRGASPAHHTRSGLGGEMRRAVQFGISEVDCILSANSRTV